jgi:bifunctional non-homologous end joining protein LigD
MQLDEYKSKRDFSVTREPEGFEGQNSDDKPRFVIQEHNASHLHYDFRLEINGVLKSWAVPKGLPPESSLKRLAVQTEDHPISYITFEGIIPEGQYGAGSVRILDNGTFDLHKYDENKLEFELFGKKYSGKYTLVRTQDKNWLILKTKEK